jgi:hypothetical protein
MATRVQVQGYGIIEFPDGMSPDQITHVIENEILKSAPAQAAQPSLPGTEQDSPFIGSLKAGTERLKGEAGLLAGKVGLMTPQDAEKYYAEKQAEAAKLYTPTQQGWAEAPGTKLKELAGGSLPYMAAPVVAAGAAALAPEVAIAGIGGATLAGGATSALQFTGSNLARQMEANKQSLTDTSLLKAGAAAVPQAALDIVGFKMIPGIRQIFGKAGIEISEQAAAEAAKRGLLANAGQVVKTTGGAMTGEGLTEAGQQVLERMQAGLAIGDADARREYLESFIGGAALGGMAAVPGQVYEKVTAKPEETKQEVPPQETPSTSPSPVVAQALLTDDILKSMEQNIQGDTRGRTDKQGPDSTTVGTRVPVPGESTSGDVTGPAADVGTSMAGDRGVARVAKGRKGVEPSTLETPSIEELQPAPEDNAQALELKRARLEELATRDEKRRQFEEDQQAQLQEFNAQAPARAESMELAELRRLSSAYPVKTVLPTTEIEPLTVQTYNEERPETLPSWNSLNKFERAYYDAVNKQEGLDAAFKALEGFKGESKETKPTQSAFMYETNRKAAEKEHKINLPTWRELSPESKSAFEQSLKRPASGVLKGENIHEAFGNVATQLESENVAYRGMPPAAVTETQTKLQEKTALSQSQRDMNVERAISQKQKWEDVLKEAAVGADEEIVPGAYRTKATSNIVADKLFKVLEGADAQPYIEFGTLEKGKAGQFNPSNNTITIDRNNLYSIERDDDGNVVSETSRSLTETVLHEMVHYALDHVIDNPKKFSASQQKAVKELKDLHIYISQVNIGPNQTVGNQFDIGSFKEFIAEAMTNSALQNTLANIKVVKMSDTARWKELNPAERKLFGMMQDVKNAFSGFITRVAAALGMRPQEAPVLESVISRIETVLGDEAYKAPTPDIKGKEISYAKTGKEEERVQSFDEMVAGVRRLGANKPRRTLKEIVKHAATAEARNFAVKKFQNDRVDIKNWQDTLQKAGKIITGEEGFNNVYDMIVTAFGRANFFQKEFLDKPVAALQSAIDNYVASSGQSLQEAMDKLQVYSEALHEPERRQVKYVMNVPLSGKKNLTFRGEAASASDIREYITNELATGVAPEIAQKYREYLDWLVNNYKDAAGFSPAGYKSTDVNSSEYNVIAGYSSAEIQGVLDRLNPDSRVYDKNTPQIMSVIKALKPVQDATIELNRKGNYWNPAIDGIKAFYGFENYVPFKGRPDTLTPGNVAQLELNGPRLSNELRSFEGRFGGRETEANNPITQTLVESTLATARAGRAGLTQAIKNAVQQKLIPGEIADTYSFADRYTGRVDESKLKERNVILNYNEDGTMDVIKIKDERLLEAIRRTYQDSHPVLDIINGWTSFVGQTHTRYNPSFPILNFVRDVLTNSYVMAIDMSPKTAASYLGAVATKVLPSMNRVFKVSRLYSKGDVAGIRKLAASDKSGITQALLEYLQEGGQVSVVQGLSVQGQLDQLYKSVGKKGIVKNKEQIDRVFDVWVNTFELSTRVGAYMATKSDLLAKGVSEKQAQQQAAVYAKRLANFEEVGQWGKAMGAMFMFFRPSATGAVRALETISPMLRDWDTVKRQLPQQVKDDPQALAQYEANFKRQRQAAMLVTGSLIGMGMVSYLAAGMMSGDDEEGRNKTFTDDMSRWTRYARFQAPFLDGQDNKVIQIPWGFGLGAFAAAGAQIAGMTNNPNMTLLKGAGNLANIAIDSFIPIPFSRMNPVDNFPAWVIDSITPSLLRPFVEHTLNINGVGQQIYNVQTRMGDAYISGDTVPEIYKDAAQLLFDSTDGQIDVSPNTLHFFANNYLDGASKLVHDTYGAGLLFAGQKEFDAKKDIPLLGTFISTKSNTDAAQYADVQMEVEAMGRRLKAFETNPEKYLDYIERHPLDATIVDFFNKQSGGSLQDLKEQANYIRTSSEYSPKEKAEMLRENKTLQNLFKRQIVEQIQYIKDLED